jgi:hypothetical protein
MKSFIADWMLKSFLLLVLGARVLSKAAAPIDQK